MNSEEIRKALEIIKEPITVNCIEYKYFDQENYDKITRVYDNCLWFANNLEQINLTVEKLEKENKQLKADYGNKAQVERDILLQEKQELIDYLKEEQLFYYNQYEYSTQQEDLKRYNRLVNEYDKILSKIERSKK